MVDVFTGFVRMLAFHTRSFAQNSYFAQLLVTSTVSALFLQVLASAASQGGTQVWLRAGMVGCWVTCSVSSGLIGFQRYQGTLALLATSPIGANRALAPIVASAASFGIVAFPLAGCVASVLGLPVLSGDLGPLLVGIVVFWMAAVCMSFLIAALFVLSPNAITYEALVATPILLVSGIFGFPPMPPALAEIARLLPLRSAVLALQQVQGPRDPQQFSVDIAVAVSCSAVWIVLAIVAARMAERKAVVAGTLDIV